MVWLSGLLLAALLTGLIHAPGLSGGFHLDSAKLYQIEQIYREQAGFLAAAVALLWLISAVNMSGVLYAVQRMNQLATLFDNQQAAGWLEQLFLDGEESAGWALIELLDRDENVRVGPDTTKALDALGARAL